MLGLLVIAGRQLKAKTLDRLIEAQVLLKNLIHIVWLNVAVPDGFRIDNDHGTMTTLIQTAGTIDADRIAQPRVSHTPLQPAKQGVRVAVEPAVGPISADKDMFLILRHERIIPKMAMA